MSRREPHDYERFDHIYATNLPLILGYATRRCAEPSEAADVAAEVFLVAWRRLDRMPPGQERLWLYGVARRVLANQRRGALRRHKLADRLRDELTLKPPLAEQGEWTAGLLDAIRQLPDRDRELLQLAVWDGLSPTEIATLEHIPAATVRSRLLRARARLREALSEPALAAAQRIAQGGQVSDTGPFTNPKTPELNS